MTPPQVSPNGGGFRPPETESPNGSFQEVDGPSASASFQKKPSSLVRSGATERLSKAERFSRRHGAEEALKIQAQAASIAKKLREKENRTRVRVHPRPYPRRPRLAACCVLIAENSAVRIAFIASTCCIPTRTNT